VVLLSIQARLSVLEAKKCQHGKERKLRVKREFEGGTVIDLTQLKKKVKMEPKPQFISGEVIDLT
jgi:hypothetical protein